MKSYHLYKIFSLLPFIIFSCKEPISHYEDTANEDETGENFKISIYTPNIETKADNPNDTLAFITLNKTAGQEMYSGNPKQSSYLRNGTAIIPITRHDEQAYLYTCFPYSEIIIKDNIPFISIPISVLPMYFHISNPNTNFATDNLDYQYGLEYKNNTYRTVAPTISNKTSSASIGMKHAFSRIRFTITATENSFNIPYGHITSLQLQRTAYALTSNSTLNISNGKIENTEKVKHGYNFYFNQISLTTSSVITWQFYALPAKAISVAQMYLVMDGNIIESGKLSDVPWQAGYHYDYEITLTDDKLSISEIKVKSWVEGEEQECIIIR